MSEPRQSSPDEQTAYQALRRRLTRDIPLAALNNSLSMRRIQVTRDIPYGDHDKLRLDIFAPAGMSTTTPIVVFYYGGRWQTGRKQDYVFVAHALASQGICCVLPDYRQFPDVRFPTFVEDGAEALAWAADNIHEFGGSSDNMFVMGHSAGAHIAAMLALDTNLQHPFANGDRHLRGLVGLSGPYDFLPMRDQDVVEVFGDKSASMESQPIHYAGPHAPPSLLITSRQDIVVRPRNAHRLADALASHGVLAETSLFANLTHAGTILALAAPLRWRAPVLEQVLTFVRRHALPGTDHA